MAFWSFLSCLSVEHLAQEDAESVNSQVVIRGGLNYQVAWFCHTRLE